MSRTPVATHESESGTDATALVLAALGGRSGVRLRIALILFRCGEGSACELMSRLGISRSNALDNLHVLARHGVVRRRIEERRHIYRLEPSVIPIVQAASFHVPERRARR